VWNRKNEEDKLLEQSTQISHQVYNLISSIVSLGFSAFFQAMLSPFASSVGLSLEIMLIALSLSSFEVA